MSQTLVVIPTYNESSNLKTVVNRLRSCQPDVDVLIVDDNSPDGTGKIADELADGVAVHVMHRHRKEGIGPAYLAGFSWGNARGYDTLVEMDADGSHLPEQLDRLLEGIANGADLVLGSRWVRGGQVKNWPAPRWLLSRGANFYVRIILRLSIKDATGGFRAFRRETLEGINLRKVASQGYCFQIDLARRAIDAGFQVVEVPITFVERENGESKMSKGIVFEALWRVTLWGFARLRKG